MFPMNIATVRTGAVALIPTVHAMKGRSSTPAPNPATPLRSDATNATGSSTISTEASGTACHHTADVALDRRGGSVRHFPRLHGQHRLPRHGRRFRGAARAG